MDNQEIANRALELTLELTRLNLYGWQHFDLFTWQWWLLVTVFIIPWIFFVKMVDKTQLPETLLLGSWVLIISESFDHIGYELGMWIYLVEIFPLFPRFEEVNFSALPVTYMLIYQKFPDWKRFTFAITVAAAIFTWICEPILIWLDLYNPIKWNVNYGFPIYIAIGLCTKWGTQTVCNLAKSKG